MNISGFGVLRCRQVQVCILYNEKCIVLGVATGAVLCPFHLTLLAVVLFMEYLYSE